MLQSACSIGPVPTIVTAPPGAVTRIIPADALVIKHGKVFDGTGAPAIPDGAVVIVKNKIAAVGRTPDFAIPPEARVIDAAGGTILPGIIDSHVHEANSALVRQFYFLRQGVTTVCDLGSPLTALTSNSFDAGYGSSARVFRSGPIINPPQGYPGDGEFLYPVNNVDEARQAANLLIGRGADMLKLAFEPGNPKVPWQTPQKVSIPNLDLPQVKAIVAQAHARGKLVRVHLGTVEMLDLALDGGVDVIEHVPLPRLDQIDLTSEPFGKLSFDYEAQLARIIKQNIVLVPTLDFIITWCENRAETPERKALCAKYMQTPVHRFYEMGGVIALGDDSGYALRTGMPLAEMRRLSAIGMSPTEILQAATRRAARVCGHGEELGTLEPGKLADVIVVPGDATQNIEALNQVDFVIIDGKVAVSK